MLERHTRIPALALRLTSENTYNFLSSSVNSPELRRQLFADVAAGELPVAAKVKVPIRAVVPALGALLAAILAAVSIVHNVAVGPVEIFLVLVVVALVAYVVWRLVVRPRR